MKNSDKNGLLKEYPAKLAATPTQVKQQYLESKETILANRTVSIAKSLRKF